MQRVEPLQRLCFIHFMLIRVSRKVQVVHLHSALELQSDLFPDNLVEAMARGVSGESRTFPLEVIAFCEAWIEEAISLTCINVHRKHPFKQPFPTSRLFYSVGVKGRIQPMCKSRGRQGPLNTDLLVGVTCRA